MLGIETMLLLTRSVFPDSHLALYRLRHRLIINVYLREYYAQLFQQESAYFQQIGPQFWSVHHESVN